jgi:copper transport protein
MRGQGRARWRRRSAALLGALVTMFVVSWVSAAPASAHAQLITSDPVDGSTLQTAPRQATLRLSESVVPSSVKAALTDGQGRTTALPGVHVATTASTGEPGLIVRPGDKRAPATVVIDLPSLPPDVYRLAWRSLSADDLHITSGVVVFGVRRDASGATGQVDDPLPGTVEVLLRWAQLAGAALAAGATALSLRHPEQLSPSTGRLLRRLALGGAGVAVVLQPVLLAVQGADDGGLLSLLTGSYGLRWTVHTAVGLLTCLWLWRRRPASALAGAALLVAWVITRSTLGHAAGAGPFEFSLTSLHVAAALLWAGGVAALVPAGVALRGPDTRDRLRALVLAAGRVAVPSLAVVALTGVALSGRNVASVDALLLSTYGRLLLLKIGLVVVVLVVAVAVRRSLGAGAVRVTVLRAEALALVAVVGVAGAVASSRPALGTQWTPSSQVQPIASAQVDDVVQTLDVQPNLPGRNFVTVDAFQTRRPAPGEIQRVAVTFQRGGGSVTSFLRSEGNGRWVLATDVIDSPGTWRMTVRVERANVPAAAASYDWLVADPQSRLAAPLVSAAPLQPWTDLGAALGALAALVLGALGVLARRRRSTNRGEEAASQVLPPAVTPAQESLEQESREDERHPVRS